MIDPSNQPGWPQVAGEKHVRLFRRGRLASPGQIGDSRVGVKQLDKACTRNEQPACSKQRLAPARRESDDRGCAAMGVLLHDAVVQVSSDKGLRRSAEINRSERAEDGPGA